MLIYVVLFLIFILWIKSRETFQTKISCKKWSGDINKSPLNICKDCGYPEDCHGPFEGDSWRHIFKDTLLY